MNKMNLQYFSKQHKKWVDFKYTDRVESLKKCEYKIRLNPKHLKINNIIILNDGYEYYIRKIYDFVVRCERVNPIDFSKGVCSMSNIRIVSFKNIKEIKI